MTRHDGLEIPPDHDIDRMNQDPYLIPRYTIAQTAIH